MESHKIYEMLASRRRELGWSQQELAERAGMRREKVNRIESQRIDVGLSEISRLLEIVGLSVCVQPFPSGQVPLDQRGPVNSHGLAPSDFEKASFFDGRKAKVISWGKVPR